MTVGTVHGGRYELLSKLGTGGFGSVWQARDTTLLRDVAVKLIEIDLSSAGDARDRAVERFRREAQAIAGLAHPNVVTAYDFGVDDDRAYLVMELVNGKSLAQVATDYAAAGQGPLDVATVLRVADDVCAGLGAAHRAGLVHRDLKPANLMVCLPSGQVKIVDFGIAQLSDRSKITRTGSYLGTLPYIAPEQLTTRVLDGRADIYALGCLLHELLAGRSAYDADTPVQWLAAHHYGTPAPLVAHLPDAPPALSDLLGEMLAKDPDQRPSTVDAVRQRVAAVARDLRGGPSGAAQLIAATQVVPMSGPAVPRATPSGGRGAAPVPGGRVYQSGNAAPATPMSGPPASGHPMSDPPVSAPPVSSPPVSGQPRSGAPMSGPPMSGPPMSGPPMSGPPMSGPPATGRPMSGPPASGPPMSGRPASGPPVSPAPAYVPRPRPLHENPHLPGGVRMAPPPPPLPPQERTGTIAVLATLIIVIVLATVAFIAYSVMR